MPVFRCRAERPGGVQKLSDQFGGTKPLSAIYESGSRHAPAALKAQFGDTYYYYAQFTPTPKRQ